LLYNTEFNQKEIRFEAADCIHRVHWCAIWYSNGYSSFV